MSYADNKETIIIGMRDVDCTAHTVVVKISLFFVALKPVTYHHKAEGG